jgi:hypothetical protein
MLAGMVADAWVYKAAGKLIEQHGDDAMTEANRLLSPLSPDGTRSGL